MTDKFKICVLFLVLGVCLGADDGPKDPHSGHAAPNIPAKTQNHDGTHEVAAEVDKHHTNSTTSSTTSSPSAQTSTQHSPTSTKPITPKPSSPNPAPPTPAPSTPAPPTPAPPTPAPPVPPVYGPGSWNVTDHNRTCILLKGEIELTVYNETDKKEVQIRVPKNAPTHGNCSRQCIEFELPNNSSLHLMFANNGSVVYLQGIKADLFIETENTNKTHEVKFANMTLHLFETPVNQSYYCAPASESLVAQLPLIHLDLKVSDFQVQAFKNSSSKSFDTAVNCQASHTPDVVPIVVGCLLALLVILVLVAYVIGRRRFPRGYQSM